MKELEDDETKKYEQLQHVCQRIKQENVLLLQENAILRLELETYRKPGLMPAPAGDQPQTSIHKRRRPSSNANTSDSEHKRHRSLSQFELASLPRHSLGDCGVSPSTTLPYDATPPSQSSTSPPLTQSVTEKAHPIRSCASGCSWSHDIPSNRPPSEGLVITDCGFCSDGTPCICREIARQGAEQRDVLNIARTFGTVTSSELHINTIPTTLSTSGILPDYQPAVQLRRRPREANSRIIWWVVPLEGKTEASVLQCSGNPSDCMACKDDSFGQAFCAALSVQSSKPHVLGEDGGIGRPWTILPSGAPVGPPTHIPTSSAWATLKSHPAIQRRTFTNLDLLAEVVVRGGQHVGENDGSERDGLNTGRPLTMVSVPADGVRNALDLLDQHILR